MKKEKSLKFISFDNIKVAKIITEEDIESYRSEPITKERETKRLELLNKLEKGYKLPEKFLSLKPFIESEIHATSGAPLCIQKFENSQQVIDYGKKIQTGEIQTPETHTYYPSNVVNKLTLNIVYPKHQKQVTREGTNLISRLKKLYNCNENQAKMLEEHITNSHPALRALLNVPPETIATVDFPFIQRYGSAMIKQDPECFTTYEAVLNLLQEAQREIGEALKKTNGDINQDVQKTLAKYDVRALEYFIKQVQKMPDMKQRVETQGGISKIIKEEYKLGYVKESNDKKLDKKEAEQHLKTKEEAINTAYKLLKKTCKHYKIESEVVKDLEEYYKKKSTENLRDFQKNKKSGTIFNKEHMQQYQLELTKSQQSLDNFIHKSSSKIEVPSTVNAISLNSNTTETHFISSNNLTPRPVSGNNENHEIQNPPSLPSKKNKPTQLLTKKLENGDFVISKEGENKTEKQENTTPTQTKEWVKFVKSKDPNKITKFPVKKMVNFQQLAKEDKDLNQQNEK